MDEQPAWMNTCSQDTTSEVAAPPKAAVLAITPSSTSSCSLWASMVALVRITIIFTCLCVFTLVIGSWIPAARIPFPDSGAGFWGYDDAEGITDFCILVQAFLSTVMLCAVELSMLTQHWLPSCALFTFRWFGFMATRHLHLLFTLFFALLACTLSWFGVTVGCAIFGLTLALSIASKRADANRCDELPSTNGTSEESSANPWYDALVLRAEIREEAAASFPTAPLPSSKPSPPSLSSSAALSASLSSAPLAADGKNSTGTGSLRPWVAPLLSLLTAFINGLTLVLLLVLVLPGDLATFRAAKIYLLVETVLLCLVHVLHATSRVACNACQGCIRTYLGYMAHDTARLSTAIFHAFVAICIGSTIAYVMGALLLANALLQCAVFLGYISCFNERQHTQRREGSRGEGNP